ncbi:glycogen/starch synthase [Soonwooa sp.]|uniref:glycogen synthase n=1 Tax=Soonwooa sp. TaxID=1938592 RepID=UPI0026278468|nr:glycogen/starch synthase [Soonwooa sp.]
MKIFHLSMECYPVAKVGGLADVVGALPKYQNKMGLDASVVMPWYNNAFVYDSELEVIFDGFIHQAERMYQVIIHKEKSKKLGFDLYLVKVPGLLDREKVYGYSDESEQFIAFQHAVLHWLTAMKIRPDILHCHDYHTGLVPFMIENCPSFRFLKGVKTVGTIHNGEYQGSMDWSMSRLLPFFDATKFGLLDWNSRINPMAAMIKSSHVFNTVSKGYLQELFLSFQGLESLMFQEEQKAFGIINGIDTEVWNPDTDSMIPHHFTVKNSEVGKWKNKTEICQQYGLNVDLPLFGFIGRFAGEKGADLLPDIITQAIKESDGKLNIIVLGSGNPYLETTLRDLQKTYHFNFALDLGYKEYLSHQIYASADFLLMPSRVEPCGLNQMYAMRYGTIPIVRYTGGLKDTVEDISSGGSGFNFAEANAESVVHAMGRALRIFRDKKMMKMLIQNNMNFNFSWEKSAENYLHLYKY